MKISPIQTNNFIVKNQNKVNHNYFIKNKNFTDSVSFKGDEFLPQFAEDNWYYKDQEFSKKYAGDEIALARQSLYLDEQEWKDFVYDDRYEYLNRGWDIPGGDFSAKMRMYLGLATCFLSELSIWGYKKFIVNKVDAKKWVEKIDLIRTDIQNAQAEEKAAELKKQTLKQQREAEQINETSKVKEEKLYPQLLNLIQREKEGKKTKIPNCVMLSHPDEKINKELIKWCGENVNAQFITTDPNEEDLIDVLEEAEADYQESGNWNLIYVKDMEELINHSYSDDDDIAAMKDLMTCCAKEFHSTLIFSAPRQEELDDIAIAPHRVKKIDTSNIKSATKANIDDAKARLNDEEYRKKTPISAINDILFLLGANKDILLTVDVLPKDLKKAEEFIKENASKENNYLDLFGEISKNIWYCKDVKINDNVVDVENAKTTTKQPNSANELTQEYVENTETTTEQPESLPETLGIKITNVLEEKIEELLGIKYEEANGQEKINELSSREEENETLISALKVEDLKVDDLKNVMVGNTSLIDFWLDLENSGVDKNKIKANDRLKNIWFNETIKDEEKVKNLISITLDKLQSENELIKNAREAYKDIIENDTTVTDDQKELLIKQQESLLFFKVISNKLNADDILKMEVNVLDTLEQLESEKSSIKENAIKNIFEPVRNSAVLTSENAEDIENSEYIIDLAKEAMLSDKFENKEKLSIALDKFTQAKLSGDKLLLDESWNEIVNLAQGYFETTVLDDVTNRNIELLNSINEKVSDADIKRIKDLIKDKTLSIEQREFIARYKDDNNFKILLNNQNIDTRAIIEDLVFFESSIKALLEGNDIGEGTINFAQIMSDKFKRINAENKDIKIQTDRVVDKLGEIETTISDFSGNFNSFANDMLDIEIDQLQQMTKGNDYLYAISNNTKEIKEYTQAITRAKLVELSKDKYYKDIIPEITQLLPSDEQFDLKDFMQKVEALAKQEKDSKKKKTIIKAGVAVVGTLALGAGAYYLGPQIVAHLASKLPVAKVGLATNEVIKATNVAKRIGNSQLVSFKQHSGITDTQIRNSDRRIKNLMNDAKAHPTNGYYPTAIRSEIRKNENLINEYNRQKAAEDAKKAADAAKKAAKKAKK